MLLLLAKHANTSRKRLLVYCFANAATLRCAEFQVSDFHVTTLYVAVCWLLQAGASMYSRLAVLRIALLLSVFGFPDTCHYQEVLATFHVISRTPCALDLVFQIRRSLYLALLALPLCI